MLITEAISAYPELTFARFCAVLTLTSQSCIHIIVVEGVEPTFKTEQVYKEKQEIVCACNVHTLQES